MTKPAISSRDGPMTFDEIRAANPDLGLAIYAIEPGQPVTLEITTPAGELFSWTGPTEAHVLALAFPVDAAPALQQPDTPEPTPADIFG